MGDATSTHIEAGLVVWVGIEAVRFALAETRSGGMGGGCGGGCGGGAWLGCGSRGHWRHP